MAVYNPVSREERNLSDFHTTCSLISRLNSPGSMQPGTHFRRTETIQTYIPSVSYQIPTYSGVERVDVWVKALLIDAQRHSKFSPASDSTSSLSLASLDVSEKRLSIGGTCTLQFLVTVKSLKTTVLNEVHLHLFVIDKAESVS